MVLVEANGMPAHLKNSQAIYSAIKVGPSHELRTHRERRLLSRICRPSYLARKSSACIGSAGGTASQKTPVVTSTNTGFALSAKSRVSKKNEA
jgi:hypothetical protein